MRKKLSQLAGNLGLSLVTVLIILLMLELLLRANPLILGDAFANSVAGKYSATESGIYEYDPLLKLQFMKPNFSTMMYYNRYRWLHTTDSKGFRNSWEMDKADIVLLGDSFIYGHGVEQNQTVAYFLSLETNMSVFNMGRQGDSPWQEAYVLDFYGWSLKPRWVVLFFFINDVSDLTHYLTEDEMREYVAQPLGEVKFRPRTRPQVSPLRWYEKIYLYKSYRHVTAKLQSTATIPFSQPPPASIAWNYTERVLQQMDFAARERNASFVIVPIRAQFNDSATHRALRFLSAVTQKNNISLINATTLDRREYYLPRDSHFSEVGASRAAQLVADYIRVTEAGQMNIE